MTIRTIFIFIIFIKLYSKINVNDAHIVAFETFKKEYIEYTLDERNLLSYSPGGGFLSRINEVCFCYFMGVAKDKVETLALIKEVSNDLLHKINSCKDIRPYLKKYPFTKESIDVRIELDKPTIEGINSATYFDNRVILWNSKGKIEEISPFEI